MILEIDFEEVEQELNVGFEELYEVEKTVIPSDYGKITYNQDKTIIVS